MEAIKLLLILALIILALRLRVSVGLVLLGAGAVSALLFALSWEDWLLGYWELVKSHRFISLTAIVVLITMLGSLLKELGSLDILSQSCRLLPGGRRTAAGLMPPMIGLLPMPGGSLLSAPLVAKALDDNDYPPELRTVTNYWFRHVAEFAWPVYPGLILTTAMTGLPLGQVALLQLPMTIIMIAIGLVFYLRLIRADAVNHPRPLAAIAGIFKAVWPIIVAIVLYAVTAVDLAWSILAVVLALLLIHRPAWAKTRTALAEGLSPKLLLLVFGVLSFQTILEKTGAIEAIPRLAATYQLPAELVIFLVCFAAGILTGMVSAYIALGYTILAGYLYQPTIVPAYILLAYVSGFLGIMLSPSHLCLVLTNQYFGSRLDRVYRRLLPAIVILGLAGLLLSWSGWPDLFRP